MAESSISSSSLAVRRPRFPSVEVLESRRWRPGVGDAVASSEAHVSPPSGSKSSVSARARVLFDAAPEKRVFFPPEALPRERGALPKVPVAGFFVRPDAGVDAAPVVGPPLTFLLNPLRCCDSAETVGAGPLSAAGSVRRVWDQVGVERNLRHAAITSLSLSLLKIGMKPPAMIATRSWVGVSWL
jgi:hypothetical protein